MRIPELRRFAPRDLAYIFLDRKRHYLGKWGSEEAARAYRAIIRDRFGKEPDLPPIMLPFVPPPEARPIVVEQVRHLALAYELYAKSYYVKCGEPTHAALNVARVRRLLAGCGIDKAAIAEINGPWLESFKLALCKPRELARPTVNEYLRIVCRMLTFGVAHGFVHPDAEARCRAVPMVRKGRPPCIGVLPLREHARRGGVPRHWVRRIRSHLSRCVRIMADVQLATGMRPNELCHLRPMHMHPTREPRAMLYRVPPEANKTDLIDGDGRDEGRVVPIGPRSLRLLRLIWPDNPREFFFSPKREHSTRMLTRRAARITVMYPSHGYEARADRRRKGGVRPITLGDHYTPDSYRRAIHRACDAANREDIENGIDPLYRVQRFGPYELRHMRATEIASREDLHVAKTVLGHNSVSTTLRYVRTRESKLIAAALKYG